MSVSAQPGTVKYLSYLFEDLDEQWIKELVSNYPTSQVEFLTEQCVERCQQVNAEKQKNKNKHHRNSNHKRHDNQFFSPNFDKQDDNNNHLQSDQLKFLYSGHIDSDDVCFYTFLDALNNFQDTDT